MIVDASAVLAMLQDEPGAERVEAVLHTSSISAVNWSEVIQKLSRHDVDASSACSSLLTAGLKVIPFTIEQAEYAANLWSPHKHLGLSLADRVCLQLGEKTGKTVLTTDRIWLKLEQKDITIELIR